MDLSGDPEIQEVSEPYENTKGYELANKVAHEDMIRILDRYAKDPQMDLYTVADVFQVGHYSLNLMLKDKRYKELYQSAKKKRGEMLVMEGFKTACEPYQKIQDGQKVSMVEVAAAKLESNYCLTVGQAMNPEYNPSAKSSGSGGSINLVVNTGVKVGI